MVFLDIFLFVEFMFAIFFLNLLIIHSIFWCSNPLKTITQLIIKMDRLADQFKDFPVTSITETMFASIHENMELDAPSSWVVPKMFDLMRLAGTAEFCIQFLMLLKMHGLEYAVEWLRYKQSFLPEISLREIDGGELKCQRVPRTFVEFTQSERSFRVPCLPGYCPGDAKRYKNFVQVDDKYYDTNGNEIEALRGCDIYAGHTVNLYYFRTSRAYKPPQCLNTKTMEVTMVCSVPVDLMDDHRSTIKTTSISNNVTLITDTRWGRNTQHIADIACVISKGQSLKDFVTRPGYDDDIAIPYPPHGDIRGPFLRSGFLMRRSGFYGLIHRYPTENQISVVNIQTGEMVRTSEYGAFTGVNYSNKWFFDTNGDVYVIPTEGPMFNVTRPSEPCFLLPSDWTKEPIALSSKYVFLFDYKHKHAEVRVYKRCVDSGSGRTGAPVLVDTLRIHGLKPTRPAFIYMDCYIRSEDGIFDINGLKKKQMAVFDGVLPVDIQQRIGEFVYL